MAKCHEMTREQIDEHVLAVHEQKKRAAVRRPQYPARPLQFRVYPTGWLVYPVGGGTPGVVAAHRRNGPYRVLVAGDRLDYSAEQLRSATSEEAGCHPHLLQLGRALVADSVKLVADECGTRRRSVDA